MVDTVNKTFLIPIGSIVKFLFDEINRPFGREMAEVFFLKIEDPTALMDEWVAVQTGCDAKTVAAVDLYVGGWIDKQVEAGTIPDDKEELLAYAAALRTAVFSLHERLDVYMNRHFGGVYLGSLKPTGWFAGHLLITADIKTEELLSPYKTKLK